MSDIVEITYRSSLTAHETPREPADAAEALAWLDAGNREFAGLGTGASSKLVIDADFGFADVEGVAPTQTPFGMVLGCSDARVPIELVFGRGVNDLFVVRLAGNTIGSDVIGSLSYALHHFPTLQIAVVLGHSQCGAVTDAADAFITPHAFLDLAASLPLRSLVDRILTAVRAGAKALENIHGSGVTKEPGYRAALIDISVALNTAFTAFNLRAEIAQRKSSVQVVYGVYDLATRRAGVPGPVPAPLSAPPADADGFRQLAWNIASSQHTLNLLHATLT